MILSQSFKKRKTPGKIDFCDTMANNLVNKTTFLDVALNYAEQGYEVFPIMEMGKTPRIPSKDGGKGCLDATTDKAQIQTWWNRYPNANVGLHCKQFFVLDVDTKNNGPVALAGLIDKYGQLPETLTQTTGSGGKHYLFQLPEKGIFIKNRSGFYPGLDVRSFGGYIVAAPSIHENGEHYAWDNWGTEIASAPEWLIELVKDNGRRFKAPDRSDVGSRDIDDARLAGYLFNGGLTEDAVFATLQARNNDPNVRDVPLPTSEIWKTVRSIGKRDVKIPSQLMQAIHETVTASKQAGAAIVKPNPGWAELTVNSPTGKAKNILANADLCLTHSPLFCNGFAYNELSCEVHLARNIVDPLSGQTISNLEIGRVVDDQIMRELLAVAQRLVTEVTFTEDIFGSAVQLVARRNSFHPVRDYLHGLIPDGRNLIDTWLIDFMGVEDDADGYARGIGRRWLISAVGRALKPGCKADCMLILEGPQGCGKSPALMTLAGADWFKDSPLDFRSKDIFGALKGVWIYELAEFDQYKGHDAARVKSLLSSQVDTYRPPYARSDVKQPRGLIFAGTCNPDKYLVDETGNKRFWPVKIERHSRANPIDLNKLADARDQIWAEAVHAYYAGEPGFVDLPELMEAHEKQARERHDNEDVWEHAVMEYVNSVGDRKKKLLTADILSNALTIPTARQGNKERDRVKKILEKNGWSYKSKRLLIGDEKAALVKTWTK